MKRRSRSWLASRAANASSRRSSMRFRASPSRPTSVRGSVVSTRCERSPPAIAAAVWPMRSSGSRPTRTTTSAKPPMSTRTPTITIPSTSEQLRERLVGGRHRDRGDGDRAVARGRGQHAVVAVRGLDGLGLADRDVRRQRRRVAGLVRVQEALVEHRAGAAALLAVGLRRRARPRRQAASAARTVLERRPVIVELALEARGRALQLRVDAVDRVRALRGVGDGADEQHPDRGDDEHARDQPPAQRRDHGRGARNV